MLTQNNIKNITFDTFIIEYYEGEQIKLDLAKGPRELYLALLELDVPIDGDSIDISKESHTNRSGDEIYIHRKPTLVKIDKKGLEYYATVKYDN